MDDLTHRHWYKGKYIIEHNKCVEISNDKLSFDKYESACYYHVYILQDYIFYIKCLTELEYNYFTINSEHIYTGPDCSEVYNYFINDMNSVDSPKEQIYWKNFNKEAYKDETSYKLKLQIQNRTYKRIQFAYLARVFYSKNIFAYVGYNRYIKLELNSQESYYDFIMALYFDMMASINNVFTYIDIRMVNILGSSSEYFTPLFTMGSSLMEFNTIWNYYYDIRSLTLEYYLSESILIFKLLQYPFVLIGIYDDSNQMLIFTEILDYLISYMYTTMIWAYLLSFLLNLIIAHKFNWFISYNQTLFMQILFNNVFITSNVIFSMRTRILKLKFNLLTSIMNYMLFYVLLYDVIGLSMWTNRINDIHAYTPFYIHMIYISIITIVQYIVLYMNYIVYSISIWIDYNRLYLQHLAENQFSIKDYENDKKDTISNNHAIQYEYFQRMQLKDSDINDIKISIIPLLNMNKYFTVQNVIELLEDNIALKNSKNKKYLTLQSIEKDLSMKTPIINVSQSKTQFVQKLEHMYYQKLKTDNQIIVRNRLNQIDLIYGKLDPFVSYMTWNDMLEYLFTQKQIFKLKSVSLMISYLNACDDEFKSIYEMEKLLNPRIISFWKGFLNTFPNSIKYEYFYERNKKISKHKLLEYYNLEKEKYNNLLKSGLNNENISFSCCYSNNQIDYNETIFQINTPISMNIHNSISGNLVVDEYIEYSDLENSLRYLHSHLTSIDHNNPKSDNYDTNTISVKFYYCINNFNLVQKYEKHSLRYILNSLAEYLSIKSSLNMYAVMQIIGGYILYSIFYYKFTNESDLFFQSLFIGLNYSNGHYLPTWPTLYLILYLIIRMLYALYCCDYQENHIEDQYKDIKYYYLIKYNGLFSIFELKLIDKEYLKYKKEMHKYTRLLKTTNNE